MKVAITGASGFVGTGLSRHLESQGHKLAPLPRALLEPTSAGHLSDALDGCTAMVHLAAITHDQAQNQRAQDELFQRVNVDLSLMLAKAAKAAGLKRFIFISSIKVNGEASTRPLRALDKPHAQDRYGKSKWAAEQALMQECHSGEMELVIIRPPLIYDREPKGNLKSLLSAIRKGIPLPLASINNARDLIALPNLCSLIECALKQPGLAGKVLLAADGVPRSTPEIVTLLAQIHGQQARLLPFPQSLLLTLLKLAGKASSADKLLGNLELDISDTCTLTGWQPLPAEAIYKIETRL